MSVLGHNPSETFLSLYANGIPNTKFTIYDTATLFGMKHQLFLDFYVEGKIWSYYLDIELLDLMEYGEFALRQKMRQAPSPERNCENLCKILDRC